MLGRFDCPECSTALAILQVGGETTITWPVCQQEFLVAAPAPVLARIETKASHGAGKPTAKLIEEVADQWAFLVKNLGVTLPSCSVTKLPLRVVESVSP